MAISTVTPNVWTLVCYQLDTKSMGRFSKACKQFAEVFETFDGWELHAKKMLTDFPAIPQEGWKNWVKKLTPVKFTEGTIDLKQKLITVDVVDVEKIVPLLLTKIPGMLFCTFVKPTGTFTHVWYRNEDQKLVWSMGTRMPLRFEQVSKNPAYQKFKVERSCDNQVYVSKPFVLGQN